MNLTDLLNQFGLFGTGILCGCGIVGLFWKADDAFSKEFKEDVSLCLQCLDVKSSLQHWPGHFVALFDWWFGAKHLTWRCFWRSSVASLLSVALLTFIWRMLRPSEWDRVIGDIGFWLLIAFTALGAVIYNLLADYISLIETRYIIGRMSTGKSCTALLFFMVLDVVLTVAIFLFCFLLFGTLFVMFQSLSSIGIYDAIKRLFVDAPETLTFSGDNQNLAIYFYSTFFTSVWIWLYAISQVLIRSCTRIDWVVRILQYILPLEDRPFRSIGIICSLIACCFFWVVGLLKVLM